MADWLTFPTMVTAGAKAVDVDETPGSQQQSNQPSGGELVGHLHARPLSLYVCSLR